jgi:hypothetical protein
MSPKTSNPAALDACGARIKFDSWAASNDPENKIPKNELQTPGTITTLRLKSPPAEIPTGFKSGHRVVKTPARLDEEKALRSKPAEPGAAPRKHPSVIDTGVDICTDLAPAHRGPIKRNGFKEVAATLIELMGRLPAEPAKSLDLRTTLAIAQLFPEQPPRRIIAALNAFAKDETKSQAARDKARFISNAVRQTTLGFRLTRFAAALQASIEIVEGTR